jgi:Tfp pilus assembly protein PilF/predicted Ser/Thr protein kinase
MHDRLVAALAERYTVERELGRGGMATVWLAHDLRHDRPVAIKVLHPELAGAIGVDRFLREVRLTARLQHPGIVPVLDSGVVAAEDGTPVPWYAMAYLDGESLRARLAREPQLPIAEALRITAAVADALAFAHRQGIVHRDIKPENVLLADGRVYVVDFGIAKAVIETGGERLTSTGLAIGTPAYMSPEQASGTTVDARTDQYSLATLLYEMLAGEPPFSGPSVQAVVARRLAEPARPVRTVRSTVPDSVERAVLRALERVPGDRYPDVAAFAAALQAPSTPALSSAPRRWSARGRVLVTGGALLVVGVGGWLLLGRRGGTRPSERPPEIEALYQRGLRGYDRRTPAGIVDAIAAFRTAVERDSTFTEAWTGLARAYVRAYERQFLVEGVPRDSVLQLAVAAVDGALAADRRSADAWLTQVLVSRQVDPTDVGPAVRSARQSLALDSTVAPAWHALAISLAETTGLSEATEGWRRGVTVNPAYTQGLAFLSLAHYWHRQYDSAAVWADSAIAVDPNYMFGRTTAGFIAIERGDFARGVSAFEAARRLSTDVEVVNALAGVALAEARAGRRGPARGFLRRADSLAAAYSPVPLHPAVHLAQAHAALGATAQALAWLARFAPREHLHFQLHLRCDPPFDPLRGDPRFDTLLTRPAPAPGRGC